jgi:hypothetical protein
MQLLSPGRQKISASRMLQGVSSVSLGAIYTSFQTFLGGQHHPSFSVGADVKCCDENDAV